ncbi:hypothetical protein CRG98_032261 [Punica granatum]|uniref:Phytocyanin domain-containing protein n=1 Tax=Punica granatum TaxID=22663 RepID=A0A2I0IV96_PUNGR|nr:hypothetical protein CRG98_032261 [Punica granatum]
MDINGNALIWGTIALAAGLITTSMAATTYTVGDSVGWTFGVDYSTWASSKSFAVGDTLVFNYGSGMHTVDEVRKSDYSTCTTGNSITTDSSGTTSILLRTTGTHYFICGVAGHCSGGMKLAITVAAAGSTVITPPSSPATTNSPPLTASNSNCTSTTNPGILPNTYYYPYNWSLGTRVRIPCDLFFTSIIAFAGVEF